MAVKSTEQCLRPLEVYNDIAKKCGATYAKVTKVSYTWTIHNFSCLQKKVGEFLSSPTFSAGANNEYKWQLQAYPNGDKSENSDYLSVFLHLVPSEKSEAQATFRMCLLNNKKKEMDVKQDQTLRKFGVLGNNWGWSKLVGKNFLQDPANCLLPDDSLTIFCNISIDEGTVELTDSEDLKTAECRLLNDLSDLFESLKLSDVTLITPDREFRAHKLILAMRSPVFSAMFQHNMLEQKESRVDIADVDDAVLVELLRFIYTGKIMNLDKIADGLLAAADKYQIEGLKDLCAKTLDKSITIENAASLLIIGDLHGCVQLKTQALTFICAYTKDIFETASYKSMCDTHPYLINEVLQAFAAPKLLSGSTDAKSS